MAKRIIQELVDDLDGTKAAETVRFGIDGLQYEIDLSTKNATKIREMLAPYVEKGTKVRPGAALVGGRAGGGRGRAASAVDRDQNRAIREWALSKGLEVSDRGRIKKEVVDRYNAEAGR